MSGAEIRFRGGQELTKRLDAARAALRLPPARPKLLPAGSAAPFFFERRDVDAIVTEIRKRLPEQVAALEDRAERAADKRFDLLGYRELDFGDDIHWTLDPVSGLRAPDRGRHAVPYLQYEKVGDHKVQWELGRHQHLSAMVRAWRLTGKSKLRDAALKQFRHFIEHNRYPRGIHWTSALEVGFRALSWVWMERLLEPKDPAREELLREIGLSARYLENNLSTYFSPNTHLLGEALALYVIGLCCPRIEGAERRRELGRSILIEEAEKQLREDGWYFEQSIYYHVYALDFYLHFHLLNERAATPLPDSVTHRIELAAEALRCLGQAGVPARFGDDDGGRFFDGARNRREQMLDPLATASVVFGRGDFKTSTGLTEEACWLLGARGLQQYDRLKSESPAGESRAFEASGIYVMSSGEDATRVVAVDAGPLGALAGGHGHSDLLSLEWLHRGKPLLIDPGTGQYPDAVDARDRFRGAAAHNTLVVDGLDQAEATGSFSWASLPLAAGEMFVAGKTLDLLIASHPGYERLSPPVVHRRSVVQFKDGLLFVRDRALGQGERGLDVHWRPASEFRIAALTPDQVRFEDAGGRVLNFTAPRSAEWTREVYDTEASPAYGAYADAQGLRFAARAELPAETGVFIATNSLEASAESRPAKGAQPAHYLFDAPGERTALWFGDEGQAWTADGWKTDARVLVWRSTDDGTVEIFAAGATSLQWRDEEFLERGKGTLQRLECRLRKDQLETWASEPERLRRKALKKALEKLQRVVSS